MTNTNEANEFPDDTELPEDLEGWDSLSPASLQYWARKGYSQSAMARRYGTTRQYPSWIVDYYGLERSKRAEALKYFPFKVSAEQGQCAQFKRLRDHLDFVVNHGDGWPYERKRRLGAWYDMLKRENFVVEFDPALPPQPGVCKPGGWTYRNRLHTDADFLIRFNEYADLPEFEKENWRFPKRDPRQP